MRGKRGKYFEIQKLTKNTSKLRRILAISPRILDENPPYFACGDFLTCSIDPEWSQDLGSLKMRNPLLPFDAEAGFCAKS